MKRTMGIRGISIVLFRYTISGFVSDEEDVA